MKVIWLDQALNHIRDIYSFYLSRNLKFADKVVNTIMRSIDLIIQHPQIAPEEPFYKSGNITVRALICMKGRFRILYYIKDEVIFIAGVMDCRQDLTQVLSGIFKYEEDRDNDIGVNESEISYKRMTFEEKQKKIKEIIIVNNSPEFFNIVSGFIKRIL